MKPYQQRKYIKTNENWYPTCPSGTVRVSLLQLNTKPKLWRVCVWGDDDFGLEKDCESRHTAKMIFNQIKDYTTQGTLKSLGFVRA